ncbi:sensor histidine kinase [Gottfriedia acidiceleris]|uniref:histidine kinase n=1 Tax=Gottfriedia acidiceleris TaxID=371036 RepID=A0ABY4JLH6_9BACI|nr:HAMP domain-containing sensor histidine kinase [Gottfriedia acidiceleris]UPM54690.1 HAMP domain-containing histidine kinase [Gottfriedia acidiceleris]
MKNTEYYNKRSRRIYIFFMASLTSLLLVGIILSPLTFKDHPIELITQIILMFIVIFALFNFIKKDNTFSKVLFTTISSLYVYIKFWTYPDTSTMYSFVAIIPIFTIFLYNRIAFYIGWALNILIGPTFVLLISFTNLKVKYSYIALDPVGNILEFLSIQLILLFVFLQTETKVIALEANHKEIQQAKQLNSIGQLAATIAHEIRNPITVVKGFAQLFQQTKTMNQDEQYYVDTMLKELEYAQIIINDYLSLAKPQTETLQVVEVNKEILNVTDLLASMANSQSIGFQLNLNQILYTKINPIEFKQVLVNLMKNAIESMHDAGFIIINLLQENEYALIEIIDTGMGMSQETIEKLGTPFYSLKERGTGIGLTVCFNIIEKFKGKIKVSSKENEGSIFRIYLPIWQCEIE